MIVAGNNDCTSEEIDRFLKGNQAYTAWYDAISQKNINNMDVANYIRKLERRLTVLACAVADKLEVGVK